MDRGIAREVLAEVLAEKEKELASLRCDLHVNDTPAARYLLPGKREKVCRQVEALRFIYGLAWAKK